MASYPKMVVEPASNSDLPEKGAPCPEALLSLAAGSVLSVLQCPPRTPTFLTSSLLLLSSSNDNDDSTSTAPSIPTTNSSETTTKALLEQQQQLHHQKCLQLSSSAEDANQQGLIHFLRNICVQAAVTELALVISLIYVDRLKKVLSSMARGDPDTPFKIMLSALLVVKKFLDEDCVGLNRLFSRITNGLYTLKDINTMERSFLGLLKYSLFVTEEDVAQFIQCHQKELQGLDILNTASRPAVAA
ncbi:MAG: hypothetical protein JOS17DRAFT_730174 [Linnemannia elongata]|nr:MAG: hypothetical protein JOS17DRAFT_730174 [Linnemannia elongata]